MTEETFAPWDDVVLGEWNSWHKLGDSPLAMSQKIETYNAGTPGQWPNLTGCIGIASPLEEGSFLINFYVTSYKDAVEQMRDLVAFAEELKHYAADFLEHAKHIKEREAL